MTIHDFAFVLNADLPEQSTEEMFFDDPFLDTSLFLQDGTLALSFDHEADSYESAVLSAYVDIEAAELASSALIRTTW